MAVHLPDLLPTPRRLRNRLRPRRQRHRRSRRPESHAHRHRRRRGGGSVFHGGGARADHRRAHLRQFSRRRRRHQGPGTVHARPPAARGRASAGARQPRSRRRAAGERQGAVEALPGSLRTRHRDARTTRHQPDHGDGAGGNDAGGPCRGRQRHRAAGVRDGQRADLGTDRQTAGQRRQPGSRQRRDAARRDQSGGAHLRDVRRARHAVRRVEALHGARIAARPGASRRFEQHAIGRPPDLRRQCRRSVHRHDRRPGDVSE